MDEPHGNPGPTPVAASPRAEGLIRQFVEHWGMMARAWGINSTMGELFALLYITGSDWTAEDLRQWLRVSRGNVSMNLRELLVWGVVRKVHRAGERRELYRAETEVWTLFRRILLERKRREIDPTLAVLDRIMSSSGHEADTRDLRGRVEPLRRFFGQIDALAASLHALEPEAFSQLMVLLGMDRHEGTSSVAETHSPGPSRSPQAD